MRMSEIKTLEGLESAQKDVARRLRDKGDGLLSSVRDLRQEYSLANMFRNGLGYVSDIVPVRGLMLLVVRRMLSVIKKRH